MEVTLKPEATADERAAVRAALEPRPDDTPPGLASAWRATGLVFGDYDGTVRPLSRLGATRA